MKKDVSSKILNNIVLVGIVLTLLTLLVTPLGITALLKSRLGFTQSNIPMIISIGIYLCAIPYVISLLLLKKLCKLIVNKDAFSPNIPIYLKKIAIYAFSEIIIYNVVQIGLYYLFDIYMYSLTIISAIIVSFVSLAIGFLSLVSSKLFEVAIEIKDENDKTI